MPIVLYEHALAAHFFHFNTLLKSHFMDALKQKSGFITAQFLIYFITSLATQLL